MSALEIASVSKSYEDVHAVKDLSLTVEEGQIFGLLGPNGAGKSSTIRMIMDIIRPDSGTIKLFGKENNQKIRDKVGYLPEERGLYKKMKVVDVALFFAEIKSVHPKQSTNEAMELLEKFELDEWKDKKVEDLSRGMQQKLQFICTILHHPKLIILDEPFTGLDPVNTNLIKDEMLKLQKDGASIVFSTHLMEQVEKLCESICLINKGQSVLKGQLVDIKKQFGKNRIKMSYDGKADFLNDSSLVSKFDDYGKYVEIQLAENISSKQVLEKAVQQVSIQQFEVAEPSLNEIFINVVKKQGGDNE